MKVAIFGHGSLLHDVRVRKSAQWWKTQGDEVIYLQAQHELPFTHTEADRTGGAALFSFSGGYLDGCPLYLVSLRYWSEAAMRGMDVRGRLLREVLGVDAVHVHEQAALSFVMMTPGDGGTPEYSEPEGVAVVYDAHEYEAGRMMRAGAAQYAEERTRIEHAAAPLCSAVVVVSPAIRDQLTEDTGGSVDPIVVPNAVPYWDPQDIDEGALEAIAGKHAGPRVVYSGLITKGRGLEELVRETRGTGWQVVFVGRMTDEGAEILADQPHCIVVPGPAIDGLWPYAYEGAIDRPHHLDLLAGADVGFAGQSMAVPSYAMALPNKFFEYAMAGIPVVSTPSVDIERLCSEHGTGRVYNPDKPGALLEALEAERRRRVDPYKLERFRRMYSFEAVCGPAMKRVRDACAGKVAK